MHHALLAHCENETVVSGTQNFGLGYDLGVEWIHVTCRLLHLHWLMK